MVDLAQYVDLFVSEATEHVEGMQNSLQVLFDKPEDKEAVATFFRHGHTLKGMAGAMGFENISGLIHALETFMTPVRNESQRYTHEWAQLAERGMNALREIIAFIEREKKESTADPELLDNLKNHKVATIEETRSITDEVVAPVISGDVRLKGPQLDLISRNVNNALHYYSRLSSLLAPMENAEIDTLLGALGNSILTLHYTMVELRLLPFELVLQRIGPLIKRTSELLSKKVVLDIDNPNIQVDRTAIEALGQAMVHLIRNAIDHGIESPQERLQRNKPGAGRISIVCKQEQDLISIVVEDDGRGIDHETVIKKAIAKGLLPKDYRMPREDILWDQIADILCTAGFSTKEGEATEISGRGVGLDAVRALVAEMGGRFFLRSQKGLGTRFTIQLPISLSRRRVLVVRSQKYLYGIPLFDIAGIHQGTLERHDGGNLSIIFPWLAFSVPGWSLYSLLSLRSSVPAELLEKHSSDFMVMKTNWGTRAIWVDELKQVMEVITRPLIPPLNKAEAINSVSVLADGSPLLVVDINNLILRYESIYGLA